MKVGLHRQPRQAGDASLQNWHLNRDLKARVGLSRGKRNGKMEEALCGRSVAREGEKKSKSHGTMSLTTEGGWKWPEDGGGTGFTCPSSQSKLQA